MAWPAWLAALRLARRRWRADRCSPAAGLAAWDLFLDPQMVAEGYWTWQAADARRCPACPASRSATTWAGWLRAGADGGAVAARRPGGRRARRRATRPMLRSGSGRTLRRCSPTPSSSACRRRRLWGGVLWARWCCPLAVPAAPAAGMSWLLLLPLGRADRAHASSTRAAAPARRRGATDHRTGRRAAAAARRGRPGHARACASLLAQRGVPRPGDRRARRRLHRRHRRRGARGRRRPRCGCSPARRCRPAGWASRTPATSSPPPRRDADVLVFVDADVVLAPDAVAGGVGLLRSARRDAAVAVPADRRGRAARAAAAAVVVADVPAAAGDGTLAAAVAGRRRRAVAGRWTGPDTSGPAGTPPSATTCSRTSGWPGR